MKTGATGTAKLSVGLYYYDLTCANLICEMIDMQDTADDNGNYAGYCMNMKAKEADGLAMGTYFKVEDDKYYYCAGFRNN